MENLIEMNLNVEDEMFSAMRDDTNRVMKKLIKNMVEKESYNGTVTIKIDLDLFKLAVDDYSKDGNLSQRTALVPKVSHKVGSVMQIKDETKKDCLFEGMEMVWDAETEEFVIRPIANTAQRSMFDDDYRAQEFADAALPMLSFLKKCYDPHTSVVISMEGAKIVRDEIGFPFIEELKEMLKGTKG